MVARCDKARSFAIYTRKYLVIFRAVSKFKLPIRGKKSGPCHRCLQTCGGRHRRAADHLPPSFDQSGVPWKSQGR
jgi:hypothetical protein